MYTTYKYITMPQNAEGHHKIFSNQKTVLIKHKIFDTISWLITLWQDFSLECITEKYFSYFSTKTYVVGTQKNRLHAKNYG